MSSQQQRYRVVEKIAAGGMAEVYRAESAGLEGFKKTVAIKRVLPHLSEKKQFIGMFLDEARLCAALTHSNVVQVFDIGVGDNTYFIVMEYVDGADLKACIEYVRKQGHTFPIEEAVYICAKMCEGLAYAHELPDEDGNVLGIVHRDISPPNVLITRYGEIKIVDFGLAKANSQLEHSEPGIIKGKFSYLSPEAAQGQSVDARTDIFAVGIMLWEMLAGRRLFMGETDLETVRQVQAAQIPPIRQINPYVTEDLEQVINGALAQDPDHRYQTARDLGRDLTEVLFRIGRSVSAFDIANIVRDTIDSRTHGKSREAQKQSIIGVLIENALFEFTSLKEGEGDVETDGDRASVTGITDMGAAPLNIGAFGGPDWSQELSSPSNPGTLPPTSYQEGNLAALEEDNAPAPVRKSNPGDRMNREVPTGPAPGTPAPAGAAAATASVEPQKGGSGPLIAILVVLILLAGAAGAYFGGLIPG